MTFHKKKHHVRISFILLILSIIFTSFHFVPSVKANFSFSGFIMSGSWMSGGLSLIYSAKIESKWLKRIVIFLNLICIYGWFFFGGYFGG